MTSAFIAYYISLTADYEDYLNLLTPYILVKEYNIFTGEDEFKHYPMSSLDRLKEVGIVENTTELDMPVMSRMVARKVGRDL